MDAVTKTSKMFQIDEINIETATNSLKTLLDNLKSLQVVDGPNITRLHNSLAGQKPNYQGASFTVNDKQKAATKTCKKFTENTEKEANKRFPEREIWERSRH